MKWIAALLSIVWLTGVRRRSIFTCAHSGADRPHSGLPDRSLELASTLAVEDLPTISPISARPIEAATSIGPASTPTAIARSQATATSALPDCPPLPAAHKMQTRPPCSTLSTA